MQTLFKEITSKRYVNGNEMKENSSNVLDQYFTKPSVALKCFQKACEVIKKYENLDDFIFLEPSAGDGVFYDLFPKNRRIGIDIEPKRDGFIQCDFLNYKLPAHQKASFYISSTFYKSTQIVENFEEVKYQSGIAVVFTSADKVLNAKLKKLFKEIDWTKYASLATNSCYHLGKSHIFQALHDHLDSLKNN
ncbi:hypothetical protein HMPREF1431_01633 [Helicobacter pylori GAMchJs106B]|uniref:hypothetical protein n=1 Tax=Helicobacter pylori TaxID=210 RepID=UPI0002BBA448|nr:hypothetical protein [Helicobacter pylori]EMH41379.1 hypothetical protein HMPREF1431_01633 [Helicobacter pylori GAMchJs106B]